MRTSYTGSAGTTINFIEALNRAAIAICEMVFFAAGSLGG